MPSNDCAVRFTNVMFRRDGKTILNGVNWRIVRGERWLLIGRNGSGKSTLLSMLPALTFPTEGTVDVLGHRFGAYPWDRIREHMRFVSSTLHRFEETMARETVEELLLGGARLTIGLVHEPTEAEQNRAEALLHRFAMKEKADRRFHSLSEGERRRTLVARALMNPGELLVLDEPCAGLDLAGREQFLQALQKECETTEQTVLYVTHNLEETMPFITHAAVLDGGQIKAVGRKQEVLTDAVLTELFDTPLRVQWEGERPWILPR